MILKQVRITEQSKEKLSRLKGKTGIQSMNILSRWALCYSLGENTMPTDLTIKYDEKSFEMSWFTFAGEYGEIYEAIVKAWCLTKDLPTDDETVAKYFRLHLERGIAHLSGTGFIKNLDDLLNLAIGEKK